MNNTNSGVNTAIYLATDATVNSAINLGVDWNVLSSVYKTVYLATGAVPDWFVNPIITSAIESAAYRSFTPVEDQKNSEDETT